jgi:iron complex transport system ATP-binding protein
MPEPLYRIEDLRFAYGPVRAVDGLTLELAPGRFYGIVGPNGCGKTTLLDLMIGARSPQAGRVLLEGRDLAAHSRLELARRVALVPQEFAVNFPFSVAETVLMGRHPHIPRFAAPAAADLAAVERAMALMEVDALAGKRLGELSGGERQRVALARALAQDAPTLLLDEPTSHLDVNHALAVLATAERLVRAEGRTVVAVMHDLNLAAAFCDEVIFLRSGRLHGQGPVATALTPRSLAEVFGVTARVAWDDFAGARVVVFQKPGGGA